VEEEPGLDVVSHIGEGIVCRRLSILIISQDIFLEPLAPLLKILRAPMTPGTLVLCRRWRRKKSGGHLQECREATGTNFYCAELLTETDRLIPIVEAVSVERSSQLFHRQRG
jgi:hypothetical protein